MTYSRNIILSASADRLEKLITERLQPGADKAQIDARIWDLFGETWAVMFTDLAGFSRNVSSFGIIHFLQIIQESQRLLIPCIEQFDGILLKTEGDSMLVIFRNVAKAMQCACQMQQVCLQYSQEREAPEQIGLCVGLGFGRLCCALAIRMCLVPRSTRPPNSVKTRPWRTTSWSPMRCVRRPAPASGLHPWRGARPMRRWPGDWLTDRRLIDAEIAITSYTACVRRSI